VRHQRCAALWVAVSTTPLRLPAGWAWAFVAAHGPSMAVVTFGASVVGAPTAVGNARPDVALAAPPSLRVRRGRRRLRALQSELSAADRAVRIPLGHVASP
jgi:hypothetical protein